MFKRLTSFFFGSLTGVIVDLVIFQILIWSGMGAAVSNMVASFIAVAVTYGFVTRYTYNIAATIFGFIGFIGWYACTITFYSWFIVWMISVSAWPPFVCKVLSLPFSFVTNFLFSQVYLGRARNV